MYADMLCNYGFNIIYVERPTVLEADTLTTKPALHGINLRKYRRSASTSASGLR